MSKYSEQTVQVPRNKYVFQIIVLFDFYFISMKHNINQESRSQSIRTSVNRVHGRCVSVKIVNVNIYVNVNVSVNTNVDVFVNTNFDVFVNTNVDVFVNTNFYVFVNTNVDVFVNINVYQCQCQCQCQSQCQCQCGI